MLDDYTKLDLVTIQDLGHFPMYIVACQPNPASVGTVVLFLIASIRAKVCQYVHLFTD